MVKEIKYSSDDLKKIVLELELEIINIKNALIKLEADVNLIQLGDKNGPYWNGSNSYHVLLSCLGQIDHNRNLLIELNKCYDYLKKLLEK